MKSIHIVLIVELNKRWSEAMRLAWIKQIDPRDPDYDPEASTLDEILNAQADEVERQWREEREDKTEYEV